MKVSLKAARVNAELTQSEAGGRLGVSKDTIKAMESGKREIKITEFKRLCRIYHCREDDIILPFNSPKSEDLNKKKEKLK